MPRSSPFINHGGDVEILNGSEDFGALYARRGAVTRKKTRISVEIVSEPLLHDFDEFMLGMGPAQAIRDVIEKQIKGIAQFAAPSTIKRRERAEAALASGVKWAKKRYSGGRTGVKPPNQTPRMFNDSGRLAEGIFVRQNPEDKSFTVNVPANRLDEHTFGDGFMEMLDQLKQLVPAFKNTRSLLASADVRAAITKAQKELFTVGRFGVDERRLKAAADARKRALRAIAKLALSAIT